MIKLRVIRSNKKAPFIRVPLDDHTNSIRSMSYSGPRKICNPCRKNNDACSVVAGIFRAKDQRESLGEKSAIGESLNTDESVSNFDVKNRSRVNTPPFTGNFYRVMKQAGKASMP